MGMSKQVVRTATDDLETLFDNDGMNELLAKYADELDAKSGQVKPIEDVLQNCSFSPLANLVPEDDQAVCKTIHITSNSLSVKPAEDDKVELSTGVDKTFPNCKLL